jgi:hypothetical protein
VKAQKLMSELLGAFELGDRRARGPADYAETRSKLDTAIESLR